MPDLAPIAAAPILPLPPTVRLTVVRYSKGWGYGGEEWLRAFAALDWNLQAKQDSPDNPGQSPILLKLRSDSRGSVWRVPLDFGVRCTRTNLRLAVLKVEVLESRWAVARSLLRLTKAHRQWRGAERLEKNGLRAARGVAILRGQTRTGAVEVLVLEALPGRTLLECLADTEIGVCQQHRLARAVGRHIASLCLAGIVNRDTKPSNLLVDWSEAGKPSITVLDTVAISRQPGAASRVGTETGLVRMARDLMLEPAGCKHPVRRTLAMRALQACFDRLHPDKGKGSWLAWRNRRWREVVAMIEAHGDPTPSDIKIILE